jgi:hypothetical protein
MRHAQKLANPVFVSVKQNKRYIPSDLVGRVFSFPFVICALLSALAVATVRSRFDDPDMWWHLRTGQMIWQTHVIPRIDTFSFTTDHRAYIAHEWLAQLLIYMAYQIGGYSGLMVWLCIATAAILIGSYVLCIDYCGDALAAFVGALTVWFFGTIGFAVRPHMIGYLCLIAELFVLQKGRTSPRWLYSLPALFALWVNCHGSFLLGMLIGFLFFAVSGLDFNFTLLAGSRWDKSSQRTFGFMLLLSVAALMLNPIGVQLLLYPLDTLFQQPTSMGYVMEWKPVQLNDVRGLALLLVLSGIALIVVFFRFKLLLQELILLGCGWWLATSHRRFLFLFGILQAPLLARIVASYSKRAVRQELQPLLGASVISASLFVTYLVFPSAENLNRQIQKRSPVGAVDFIRRHSLRGPMLNDWGYGGYLVWALPEVPDFIDGRGDVFEWTGVLDEFIQWSESKTPVNSLLDKYRIAFCLLDRESSITNVMKSLPDWTLVYADDHSMVFVRGATQERNP